MFCLGVPKLSLICPECMQNSQRKGWPSRSIFQSLCDYREYMVVLVVFGSTLFKDFLESALSTITAKNN